MDSKYIAEDLIQDFDAGLEFAEAECILDVQNRGDSRQYLIKYAFNCNHVELGCQLSTVLLEAALQLLTSSCLQQKLELGHPV